MTENEQNDNEIEKREDGEGKGRSGKGSADKGDSGAIGAGNNAARFSINPQQLKEIWAQWKQLNVNETVAAVAEFFGEKLEGASSSLRASANLVVDWTKAANLKNQGYALVNEFTAWGATVSQLLRERTAGNIKRLRTQFGIKVARNARPNSGPAPAVG